MIRKISEGRSVFHAGQFYVAGQERELSAAMKGSASAAEDVARLTEMGAIEASMPGPSAEAMAADPTLRAGEADAVLEDSGSGMSAAVSPVEARPGLYTEQQGRKARHK